MLTLLLTLGLYLLCILMVSMGCWMLFARKMTPLRFPSPQDPQGSHHYWIRKLRVLTFLHTLFLMLFIVVFFLLLW